MVSLIQLLDRQKQREASRRLTTSSLLLSLVIVLAFAVAASTRTEPNTAGRDEPKVERLQRQVDDQREELAKWRERFAYCKVGVNWSDPRCSGPTGSVGSIPVTDSRNIVVRDNDDSDSDSDDDDGGGRTVVVRPTTVPKDPTGPATNQPPDEDSLVDDLPGQVTDTVDGLADMLTDGPVTGVTR